MGFRIREIEAECKFSSALSVQALSHAIPAEAITRVLQQEARLEERERKLTMAVVVWLLIALHLYTTLSIGAVLCKLARGLRFIWPDPTIELPEDSAIAYRRALSASLPASRYSPDPWRLPLRLAPDGHRWRGRRCTRYTGQCRLLWTPHLRPRYGRPSASARGLAGRVWHPRHRRLRLLALPHERACGRLSDAAQPVPWHAGDVGPRLSRLRHDCGRQAARRARLGSLAQRCQATEGAHAL